MLCVFRTTANNKRDFDRSGRSVSYVELLLNNIWKGKKKYVTLENLIEDTPINNVHVL